MKVVIDIDKEYYELLKYEVDVCHNDYKPIVLIAKGKPLPKGHGRLIDADELRKKWIFDAPEKEEIDNVPTIIEAESEVSE